MGFKKQNSRKKAENGDFQVVGSLLYAHYPIYFFLLLYPSIYEVYRGYIVFGFSVKMFVCVCVCVCV